MNKEKNKITCERCGYIWIPRIENPKECPKCKRRLDKDGKRK